MGQLTTHVLDLASGRPAAGLAVEVFGISGEARDLVAAAVTNADGRCEKPLLAEEALEVGTYELVFHVGPYFAAQGATLTEPPFLDKVPIRFAVSEADGDYHVPLLVSPYGYSTYRGS